MLDLFCARHQKERSDAWDKYKKENGIKDTINAHLIYLATKEIDTTDCSDCKIVGLNHSGQIAELQSPDDWLFA